MKWFLRIVIPVVGTGFLASTSFATGVLKVLLFATGILFLLLSVFLTELALLRVEAERVLNTAVDFIHAIGAVHVRANYAARRRGDTLRMKYRSHNYHKWERVNEWDAKSNSCASAALDLGVIVLGGQKEKMVDGDALGILGGVHVMKMKILEGETIRCVLCVPVKPTGKSEPIGVITFDDRLPLDKSLLASREVLQAVRELALRGFAGR